MKLFLYLLSIVENKKSYLSSIVENKEIYFYVKESGKLYLKKKGFSSQ